MARRRSPTIKFDLSDLRNDPEEEQDEDENDEHAKRGAHEEVETEWGPRAAIPLPAGLAGLAGRPGRAGGPRHDDLDDWADCIEQRNPATRRAGPFDVAPLPTPREAFVATYPKVRDALREAPTGSYLVAAFSPVHDQATVGVVVPGDSLTVGRHSCCQLELPSRDVALWALVTFVSGDSRGARLRIWDLQTSHRFKTDDGRTHCAIATSDRVCVQVRREVVWFLPSGELEKLSEDPATAWQVLEANPAESPEDFVPLAWADAARVQRRRATFQKLPEPSRITSLRPIAFDDVARKPERAPYALIRIKTGWAKSVRAVTREQLARGVLLGRYRRCSLHVAGFDPGISRVHLLLFRVGERILAVDTASTNGVGLRGSLVSAAEVGDGDHLQLGPTTVVTVSRPKQVGVH